MSAFTQRMQDCLHFIETSIAAKGISPSMQEICAGVGLSPKSKAYASALVRCLEERGALRRVRIKDGQVARRGIVLVASRCPKCGEALPPGVSAPETVSSHEAL